MITGVDCFCFLIICALWVFWGGHAHDFRFRALLGSKHLQKDLGDVDHHLFLFQAHCSYWVKMLDALLKPVLPKETAMMMVLESILPKRRV